MEDILLENAKSIARRMLWSGSVSFKLISDATELPPETVDALAAEVCREKASLFHKLRGITAEPDKRAALFDAVLLMNWLFYMRETKDDERADLKKLFSDMDDETLSRMLARLPACGPGAGMAAEGIHFINSIYADLMRRRYDA